MYNTLQYCTVVFEMMQCSTSTVWYNIRYNTAQHSTVLYNITQCSTVRCRYFSGVPVRTGPLHQSSGQRTCSGQGRGSCHTAGGDLLACLKSLCQAPWSIIRTIMLTLHFRFAICYYLFLSNQQAKHFDTLLYEVNSWKKKKNTG